MNSHQTYSKVLLKEVCTIPFALLMAIFLVFVMSDAWMVYDGANFHVQNFFIGRLNNEWDFTRYVAVIVSDIFDLAYVRLGGRDFAISNFLFRFGHAYHIFFPFFLLVYLKYKEPELSEWARVSMYIYLISLAFFSSVSFLHYVTEMKVAHSMTWTVIFAFRSQSEAYGNREFKHAFLWTISILSLFTYPLAAFTFAFLLLSCSMPLKDAANANRESWRVFFSIMILMTLILFYSYVTMYNEGPGFLSHFKSFRTNETVQFVLFACAVLITLKPFFRAFYLVLVPALAMVYIYGSMFSLWQSNPGRFVGIIGVIIIQFFYVFIYPYMGSASLEGLKKRSYAIVTLVILMLSHQSFRLRDYNNILIKLMDQENRTMSFSEARKSLGYPYGFWLLQYGARSYTISLQILRGQKHITSYIHKDETTHHDFIDSIMKTKHFGRRASESGISFVDYHRNSPSSENSSKAP